MVQNRDGHNITGLEFREIGCSGPLPGGVADYTSIFAEFTVNTETPRFGGFQGFLRKVPKGFLFGPEGFPGFLQRIPRIPMDSQDSLFNQGFRKFRGFLLFTSRTQGTARVILPTPRILSEDSKDSLRGFQGFPQRIPRIPSEDSVGFL